MMIASIVADSAPESKRDDIEQEIVTDLLDKPNEVAKGFPAVSNWSFWTDEKDVFFNVCSS